MARGARLGSRAVRRILSRSSGRSRINLMMMAGCPLAFEGMRNLPSGPAVTPPVLLNVGSLVCAALDEALDQEDDEDEPR